MVNDATPPIHPLTRQTYDLFATIRDLLEGEPIDDSPTRRLLADPIDGEPLRTLFTDLSKVLLTMSGEIGILRREQNSQEIAVAELRWMLGTMQMKSGTVTQH